MISARDGPITSAGRLARSHILLISIVTVGFCLRLAWALHVQGSLLFGDGAWYTNVAANLVHGHGFVANHNNPILEPPDRPQPTAYYPPLYPVVLAGWWRAFGIGSASAELLNVCLGTLAIPLVYFLGTKLFHRSIGLASAATYALVPNAIVWLPLPLTEALFTAIFLAALCVLVSFDAKRGPAINAAIFGLLTGLALLTRGEGVVLLPVALVFWIVRHGWRLSLGRLVLAAAVTMLVITPWTVRNWIQLDSPVAIATSTGVNLRIGHSPDSTGTFVYFDDPIDGVPGDYARLATQTEVRAYSVYTQRALSYALRHPGRELALTAQKIRYLFQSEDEMGLEFSLWGGTGVRPAALDTVFGPLVTTSWYALLATSVLLAPFWLRRNRRAVLLATVFALWIVFHVAFFGRPRFHLPLLPLVVITSVAGLAALVEKLRYAETEHPRPT